MRKLATLSLVVVGCLAMQVYAGPVKVGVTSWTDPVPLVPGSGEVFFDIWVDIDPTYDAGGVAVGNAGLVALVYDVVPAVENPATPLLEEMADAQGGWDYTGAFISKVSGDHYNAAAPATSVTGYNGGWGFDTGGLPTGGNVTTPVGTIKGAGLVAIPFGFVADVRPGWAGLQPNIRMGVGHGVCTLEADDGRHPGLVAGTGVEMDNGSVPGDGHWVLQNGHIDVSGWGAGTYTFDIVPTSFELLNGSLDYNNDQAVDYSVTVPVEDREGSSFTFTIIPEPATLGLLLIAGVSVIRRRR